MKFGLQLLLKTNNIPHRRSNLKCKQQTDVDVKVGSDGLIWRHVCFAGKNNWNKAETDGSLDRKMEPCKPNEPLL